MTKVKVDARQTIIDIRAGLSDLAMMRKYRLSSKGLQSLFKKLLQAGLISQSEIDDRMPLMEKTVDIAVFRCPKCEMPQFSLFDECPQCGVIVSKYREIAMSPVPAADDTTTGSDTRSAI